MNKFEIGTTYSLCTPLAKRLDICCIILQMTVERFERKLTNIFETRINCSIEIKSTAAVKLNERKHDGSNVHANAQRTQNSDNCIEGIEQKGLQKKNLSRLHP